MNNIKVKIIQSLNASEWGLAPKMEDKKFSLTAIKDSLKVVLEVDEFIARVEVNGEVEIYPLESDMGQIIAKKVTEFCPTF